MGVRLHHVFPIFVLSAVAAGSIWLEKVTGTGEARQRTEVTGGPDLIVEQMSITKFDINGVPKYFLDAREMQHYPGEAQARLTSPVVNMIEDPMHMRWSSETALTHDSAEQVDLAGNVRGERTVEGEPTMYFASESLTVWPDTESARSDTRVTITRDGSTASGDRMTAENVFGALTLTGNVKTHMPIKRK